MGFLGDAWDSVSSTAAEVYYNNEDDINAFLRQQVKEALVKNNAPNSAPTAAQIANGQTGSTIPIIGLSKNDTIVKIFPYLIIGGLAIVILMKKRGR